MISLDSIKDINNEELIKCIDSNNEKTPILIGVGYLPSTIVPDVIINDNIDHETVIIEVASALKDQEKSCLIIVGEEIEVPDKVRKGLLKSKEVELKCCEEHMLPKNSLTCFDSRNNEPFYAKFYNKRNKRRRFN